MVLLCFFDSKDVSFLHFNVSELRCAINLKWIYNVAQFLFLPPNV